MTIGCTHTRPPSHLTMHTWSWTCTCSQMQKLLQVSLFKLSSNVGNYCRHNFKKPLKLYPKLYRPKLKNSMCLCFYSESASITDYLGFLATSWEGSRYLQFRYMLLHTYFFSATNLLVYFLVEELLMYLIKLINWWKIDSSFLKKLNKPSW